MYFEIANHASKRAFGIVVTSVRLFAFIAAVNLSMVELCCLIPAHVPTASPSPISATTADVVLGKSTT
jgi:hypothetical protein